MDYKKIVLHLVIFCIFFVSVMSMVTAQIAVLEPGKVQTPFSAFLSGPSANVLADFLSEPIIMNNLDPTITSISPTSARINDTPFVFIVNGSNFADGYKIVIGDTGYGGSTLYNSPNQLELSALDPSTLTLGQHNVFVRPPGSAQAGDSNTVAFTVYNPFPNPTSISPSSIAVGYGIGFYDVRGNNFVDGSVVNFNGSARATTYFSPTHLQVILLATDVATAGTFNITVTNPSTAFQPDTIPAVTFTVTAGGGNIIQPIPTYTLTVNSAGAAGVLIAGSTSAYSGNTNYTKTGIASGTAVGLFAPMTSGGNNFVSWSGCTSTSGVICNVTMSSSKAVTATYIAP